MREKTGGSRFGILANRSFIFLWGNGSVSVSGDMSELLVMGWLAHQLTGSAWDVALVGLCRTSTVFCFALIAGAIGDRRDRRLIIMLSNIVTILTICSVLILLITEGIQPYHLFIAGAVRGASRAFDNTSRRALMFNIVGSTNLVRAISMEQIGFSIGRIATPLAIGALLQITGSAVSVYIMLLSMYVAGFFCMFGVQSPPPAPDPQRRPVVRSVAEGFKYAYSNPPVAGVLVTTVVMNVLFQFHLFIPVIAAEHLQIGAGLMGLLAAADGFGFIIGSALIGALGSRVKISGATFLGGCFGVTVFLLAFALSPWYFLSFGLLVILGVFQVGFSTMQSGIMLVSAPSRFHGRILGVQSMAVGSGQMGNIEIGAVAAAIGISMALVANALVGMALVLLIAALMPALRRPIQPAEEEEPQPEPPPREPPPSGVFRRRSWLHRRATAERRRRLLKERLLDLRKPKRDRE